MKRYALVEQDGIVSRRKCAIFKERSAWPEEFGKRKIIRDLQRRIKK
jgi:hypothetical protein